MGQFCRGFYTIPSLDAQSQDGFYALIGCVFVKNQPKKSRLDVYNFFNPVFDPDYEHEVINETGF